MIGDVLITSVLFEAIKHKFPKSELHYVINSHTYPVVKHNPFVDKFHFFTPEDEDSILKLWQFTKALKSHNFDAVIDVYSKLSSNLMSWKSNAKLKISLDKGFNKLIYNHRFKNKAKPETKAGLAIENRLQLLQALGITGHNICKPKIFLKTEEIEFSKQFLLSKDIDLSKPLFMIAVLGSSSIKTLPFDYMAKTIDFICTQIPNSQILFNYIPKQKEQVLELYNLCSDSSKSNIYLDVFGKSLREFLALTFHCTALIGNEGGATNMAKALDIPTFTIFSPWIKKEAWNMFDDGKKHTSVHLEDYNKEPYLNIAKYKELKKDALDLYKKLKPELFTEKLGVFLLNNA